MLSEREQRALQEIELRISVEDPRFAGSMRRLLTRRGDRWFRRGHDLIIVIAVGSALLCLGLSATGAAVVAIALAAATFCCRPHRSPSRMGRPRTGAQRAGGWTGGD